MARDQAQAHGSRAGPKRRFGPRAWAQGTMGLVPAHVMGMGSCQEPRPIIWAWAIGHIIYTTTIYTTYTTTYTIPYHPGGGPPGLGAQGAASNMDMESKQGKNIQNTQTTLDFSQMCPKMLDLFTTFFTTSLPFVIVYIPDHTTA